MPTLFLVAGVNGSGKSTLTRSRLFRDAEVIDPDEFAKRLTARSDQAARIAAGRLALRHRQLLFRQRATFVLETTFAGQGALKAMEQAKRLGYSVELHYVFLLDVAQSADRVKTRVAKGGHDIPLRDIQRRFGRSRENVLPGMLIADRTVLYDNASIDAPLQRVCQVKQGVIEYSDAAPAWVKTVLDIG